MTTLVLGAGGFVGVHLVEALRAAGVTARCGRRRRSNVLGLRRLGVPLVLADLDDPASLAAAMDGCDTVFHLAGHYPRLSLEGDVALATGTRQMRHVLDAAAAAGVRRLLYVSSTATVAPAEGGGPSNERHVHPGPPGHGTYHDLKWAMEAMAAAEDRFAVTTVCPGACLGPGDLRVGTSALLIALARGLDPPHPDGVVSPVDVRDVALALTRLAALPDPPPRLLLAQSSRPLHALLVELAGHYGVAPPGPPLAAADAVALADAEEASARREGRRPLVAREIVDLILHSVPLDTRLAQALDLRFRPLAETVDALDGWARRVGLIPPPPHKESDPCRTSPPTSTATSPS